MPDEQVDNGGQQVELASEYDLAGNLLRLAASFDVGEGFVDDLENVATFDKLHRLVRLEQSGVDGGNAVAEKRIDLAYNAASQFTTITRFNDLDGGEADIVAMSAFGYDLMGRLTDLTHGTDVDKGVPTTTIADYHWTYDADSRITEMSFTALVGLDGTSAYSYDNTDQLIGADHDFQADEEHDLDENGNRTEGGYTTDANNVLTSDGIWNYGTDDEGNRIWQERISEDPADDHRIEFGFDHRNRLTSIVYKDEEDNVTKSIAYVYDVFDRRIEKEIDWDGEGEDDPVLVQYIYDGVHILLAFNGDNELTNRYLHGLITDQAFSDEQVTDLETVGEVLWILPDNQGSARDIVDSGGDVLNHVTYSAAGEVTSETASAVDTIFGAFGRERDAESLLDYNRARYLDTAAGRFTSEDPKGFAAGDTNLSRYVFNSPTNFTDPSGLDPGEDIDTYDAMHVIDVMGAHGDRGDARVQFVLAAFQAPRNNAAPRGGGAAGDKINLEITNGLDFFVDKDDHPGVEVTDPKLGCGSIKISGDGVEGSLKYDDGTQSVTARFGTDAWEVDFGIDSENFDLHITFDSDGNLVIATTVTTSFGTTAVNVSSTDNGHVYTGSAILTTSDGYFVSGAVQDGGWGVAAGHTSETLIPGTTVTTGVVVKDGPVGVPWGLDGVNTVFAGDEPKPVGMGVIEIKF